MRDRALGRSDAFEIVFGVRGGLALLDLTLSYLGCPGSDAPSTTSVYLGESINRDSVWINRDTLS